MSQSFKSTDVDKLVCIFCDGEDINEDHGTPYCPDCKDYKGVVTVAQWEETTGGKWAN